MSRTHLACDVEEAGALDCRLARHPEFDIARHREGIRRLESLVDPLVADLEREETAEVTLRGHSLVEGSSEQDQQTEHTH